MNAFARRHLNRPLWGVCFAACLALAFATAAHAAKAVRWQDVTVTQGESTAALQEAIRIALVRATGRRDADTDPALAGLIAQPRRFVQIVRAAPAGGTQVTFDGNALERAIVAAGRTVWPRERPVVLVVTQGGAAAESDSGQVLTDTALLRGLPITVAPASSLGVPAVGEVARDIALGAAQRAGADAVVVGSESGGVWRWSLFAATLNEAWSGSAADGVHGAADAIARAAEAVMAMPEFDAVIELSGVASLKDFAVVSNALSSVNGVRRAAVTEASVDGVVFKVTARGGIETLLNALASDTRFQRADPSSGGAIAFRFRP
jgi:hypothetical protein